MSENAMRPFEEDAAEVLGRLRSSFSGLLASLGKPVRGAADLRRVLGIDNKLCWQIVRVANAREAMEVGPHVPTRAGLKSLCAAAGRKGVPKKWIEEIDRTGKAFDELVAAHAGDRVTFDSMIAPYADQENVISVAHRRAAYRANSHILGMQAETQIKCVIFQPNADEPAKMDAAIIRGYQRLRQLRINASLVLSHMCVGNENEKKGDLKKGDFSYELLDPEAASEYGVSALRKYCSEPLNVRHSEEADGIVMSELVPLGVGNRGAVNYFEGNVIRNIGPRYRTAEELVSQGNTSLQIPCQVYLHDYLVRRDVYQEGEAWPEFAMYAESPTAESIRSHRRDRDRLPMGDEMIKLGHGLSVMHTPLFSRYIEMLEDVFGHLGWDAEQFEVYRCVVEYPVVPSVASMQCALPPSPASA